MAELLQLSPASLTPTAQNPRVFRRNAKFEELVASVKAHGVLQPILARPIAEEGGLLGEGGSVTRYEIRAGERRWRAATEAGLEMIPVFVKEMTDREALEVTITENMAREDLHPLEEASGVQAMLDGGWSVEEAAARLGKSERWIRRRAALTGLIGEFRRALQEGLHVMANRPPATLESWGVVHLELVAPLSPASQMAVLDIVRERSKYRPVDSTAELRGIVDGVMRTIASAPWPKKKFDGQPPCAGCLKRSDANGDLFEDGGNEKTARCLDVGCWDAKLAAWTEKKCREALEEHGDDLVLVGNRDEGRAPGVPAEVLKGRQVHEFYMMVSPEPVGSKTVPVLRVSGREAGKVGFADPKDLGLEKKGAAAGGKEGAPPPIEERIEAYRVKRVKWAAQALLGLLEDSEVQVHLDDSAPVGGVFDQLTLTCGEVVGLALAVGTLGSASRPFEAALTQPVDHVQTGAEFVPRGTRWLEDALQGGNDASRASTMDDEDVLEEEEFFDDGAEDGPGVVPPWGVVAASVKSGDWRLAASEGLARLVSRTVASRLKLALRDGKVEPIEHELRGWCGVYRVSVDRLLAEAERAVPWPKGWAKEAEAHVEAGRRTGLTGLTAVPPVDPEEPPAKGKKGKGKKGGAVAAGEVAP